MNLQPHPSLIIALCVLSGPFSGVRAQAPPVEVQTLGLASLVAHHAEAPGAERTPAVAGMHLHTFRSRHGDTLTVALEAALRAAEAEGFAGVALVAQGDDVLLHRGYGLADRAADVQWGPTTVFDAGSITKSFTAAAVLALQEQGLLSVADPLAEHLRGVPDDKRGVTLHHLLTHSAGLPEALGFDYAPVGRGAFVRQALQAPLSFQPGTDYAYSNVGYALLAAVVERVSGAGYEDFLRDHLLGPAGMERTGYLVPDWPIDSLAHGYTGDGEDWGTPLDQPWDADGPFWNLRGNGGLLTTAADLWRWHRALGRGGVLGDRSLEQMHAPHVREGAGAESFYGYGWVVEEAPGERQHIWHNGGNPYFSAHLSRYPDDDVVVVVASNGRVDASGVAEMLSQIATGAPAASFVPVAGLTGLPDTPAGQAAAAFVEALQGPETVRRQFAEEQISPQVLAQIPVDQIVGMLGALAQELGGDPTVVGVAEGGPHALRLELSGGAGQRVGVDVRVEPEEPHRIAGLSVD